MKENLNVFETNIELIGVKVLDFKSNDGNLIRGYRIYYLRELAENEKSNSYGRVSEYKFIAKENLDDLDKYKNRQYPCKAKLEYEIVGLN